MRRDAGTECSRDVRTGAEATGEYGAVAVICSSVEKHFEFAAALLLSLLS